MLTATSDQDRPIAAVVSKQHTTVNWWEQGGHSFGRKKFKDFSRILNSLFQTYSVNISARLQRF